MRTFSVLALAVAGATVLAEDKPEFKSVTKRDTDRVVVKTEKDRTVFDITSPFGISDATIERTGGAWPDTVVVRLHLSGLENFTARSEKASASGHVQNPSEYEMDLTVDGKKVDPKDPKSAHFMHFKAVGKDGKTPEKLPVQDGYFEMWLPKSFFQGNPKTITLAWVDWYRR